MAMFIASGSLDSGTEASCSLPSVIKVDLLVL